MLARGAVKLRSPEQKKWLIVAACHAGMLADHRTPVGSAEIIYGNLLELMEQTFYHLDLFLSTHALSDA